jgi:hypothetical protein
MHTQTIKLHEQVGQKIFLTILRLPHNQEEP